MPFYKQPTMALRSLVKISSVTNLSDARYAAGMGVELMGFDLNPDSDNYLNPESFHAITSWISGVKIVGELNQYQDEKVAYATREYTLDYIQINASSSRVPLKELPIPVIIKIENCQQNFIAEVLDQYGTDPKWYLLEPPSPMSTTLLDWCKQKAGDYPIILGSNIELNNLDQLLSNFSGIALKGGQEIKPGFKNFDELADILEALETDF